LGNAMHWGILPDLTCTLSVTGSNLYIPPPVAPPPSRAPGQPLFAEASSGSQEKSGVRSCEREILYVAGNIFCNIFHEKISESMKIDNQKIFLTRFSGFFPGKILNFFQSI